MNITILCVGKIKEKFYQQAIEEYAKRLSRYCKLQIVEVPDEKTPDKASEKEELQIKRIEGERLLKQVREQAYVIGLAIDGKAYDSVGFSKRISHLGVSGNSELVFVIGGSLGLDAQVLKRCNEKISFSAMTFPHQLMRVILLEQIYRGYRIMNHEPYHK
ncbi:MAG: 23S rRNA (pseudouridine(1915)-N(3))-methyltransferase RlmH [Eubacterium sp.]|nr:23S rRNA (pseudouridine(1915)-N(3))-methyltransferase RlmH [Eubacterium sp.]